MSKLNESLDTKLIYSYRYKGDDRQMLMVLATMRRLKIQFLGDKNASTTFGELVGNMLPHLWPRNS